MSSTRMTTLTLILSQLFSLDDSDAISCSLNYLNSLWYIIIIMKLYSYVEQVMTMCHIQERQLLLSYLLSYFPLTVSHTKMTTLAFILSELFPLDCFRCNFVSAP